MKALLPKLAVLAAATALFAWCAAATGVSPDLAADAVSGMASLAAQMTPPELGYLPEALGALLSTIRMAFLGTLFGALFAQAAIPAADRFVNRNRVLCTLVRLAVHVIRCTPVLITALILTFIFGLGEWTGTLAVTLSTFAILTRIGFEDSANARLAAAKALEAAGAGRLRAWLRTVRLATLPGFLGNALYLLESNTRQAAVLGFVGAGGIGLILNETLAWRAYTRAGCILMVLLALVAAVEWLSERLQAALAGRKALRSKPLWLGALAAAAASCLATLAAPDTAHWNPDGAAAVLSGLLTPNPELIFSLAEDAVPAMLLETAQIAILGTFAGTVLACFFALTASFRLLGRWALPGRVLLLAVRSVPVLVYGLLWIRVTGPGPAAGVLTLTLCSVGLLSKRFLLAIDAPAQAAPRERRRLPVRHQPEGHRRARPGGRGRHRHASGACDAPVRVVGRRGHAPLPDRLRGACRAPCLGTQRTAVPSEVMKNAGQLDSSPMDKPPRFTQNSRSLSFLLQYHEPLSEHPPLHCHGHRARGRQIR